MRNATCLTEARQLIHTLSGANNTRELGLILLQESLGTIFRLVMTHQNELSTTILLHFIVNFDNFGHFLVAGATPRSRLKVNVHQSLLVSLTVEALQLTGSLTYFRSSSLFGVLFLSLLFLGLFLLSVHGNTGLCVTGGYIQSLSGNSIRSTYHEGQQQCEFSEGFHAREKILHLGERKKLFFFYKQRKDFSRHA